MRAMAVARAPRGHFVVLAMLGLLVTGCGSEQQSGTAGPSSGGPSVSGNGPSAPPGTQQCASVWKDGVTLDRRYRGCLDGAAFVPRDALGCESGQFIIRYADRYYAVPGGTVHAATTPLDRDRHYRAAVYRCRA